MSLVSQRTNLKSLRYGRDRPGGGDSGQPYIKTDLPGNLLYPANSFIPFDTSLLDTILGAGRNLIGIGGNNTDFILRGGTSAISRSAKDVSRLTQMFFDFKSPKGILFSVKQNVLSKINVKTQASGFLNQGAYLPTSTILQAAGNAFGVHLNKQGLNPFRKTSPSEGVFEGISEIVGPLGLPTYAQIIKSNQVKEENRLVQLANKKLKVSPTPLPSSQGLFSFLGGLMFQVPPFASIPLSSNSSISTFDDELLSYSGGPGSTLGIGKTIIQRYSNTTQGVKDSSKDSPYNKKYYGITNFSNVTPTQTSIKGIFTLRTDYQTNAKTNTNRGLNFDIVGNDIFKGKYYVLDAKTIFSKVSSKDEIQISDFRTEIPSTQIFSGGKKNILSAAPNYNTPGNRIETRVNLGDPGRRNKDVSSYAKGLGAPLDKITAMPLYQSDIANHRGDRNDLVKFSIGIIDNDNPDLRTYIHFRAFLDSMDDNYTAEWDAFKYMGRGENFYRYGGFNRTINLGWTIAAQSKEELIPMYQKLNFLASSLAPDYSANGYMRGNLAVLTVGGYLFDQPGIITSINYSVPTESPWEIGINDSATINNDSSVKELPHIIKVTGFSFIPIHKFVPKLQKNTYGGTYNKDNENLDKVISKFGKDNETGEERYIALATGNSAENNNYDSPGKNSTWGIIEQAKRKLNQNTSISSTGINLNNSSQLGRTFGSLPSISSEFRATSTQRRANVFGNANLFNR